MRLCQSWYNTSISSEGCFECGQILDQQGWFFSQESSAVAFLWLFIHFDAISGGGVVC